MDDDRIRIPGADAPPAPEASSRADGLSTAFAVIAVLVGAAVLAAPAIPHGVKALVFDGALVVVGILLWQPARRALARWRAEAGRR